ncbi:hypothetical protein C8J56DRAFT_951024 [Mycena floridula]|nr:hypothetical protein C8J56DRAFT_951024 [Mycena floridula]
MSTKLASSVQSLDIETALSILSTTTSGNYIAHLEQLVQGYVASCKATPGRTSEYTSFLLSIESSERLPTVPIPQPYAVTGPDTIFQEKLGSLIAREIFETIRDLLNDDEDHEISPENPYLIAALVSGSLMATSLCSCSDQTYSISEGLQLEPYDEEEPEPSGKEKEIKALHACLQTLIAGKTYKRHADVPDAVRKLKKNGVARSEVGQRLVEATLIHAQENRPILSSQEAWRILFP